MRYWSGKKQRRNFKEFHHPREFENPFFRRGAGKPGRRSWRLKIDTFLLFITVTGWVYFLFFSPYFLIKDIAITGNKEISYSEINNYFAAQNNKNIFLAPIKPLENDAKSQFILKDVSIKKIYPASIKIDIIEREPFFNIAYNNKIYLIDGEGVIFKELFAAESVPVATSTASTLTLTKKEPDWYALYKDNIKNNLPFVEYNVIKNALSPGSIILKPKIISAVKNIFNMEKISADFKINYIMVKEGNESQITVRLGNTVAIYFDGELNINNQINNLKTLFGGKLAGKLTELKYIDLRFGERVYFK